MYSCSTTWEIRHQPIHSKDKFVLQEHKNYRCITSIFNYIIMSTKIFLQIIISNFQLCDAVQCLVVMAVVTTRVNITHRALFNNYILFHIFGQMHRSQSTSVRFRCRTVISRCGMGLYLALPSAHVLAEDATLRSIRATSNNHRWTNTHFSQWKKINSPSWNSHPSCCVLL